MNRDPDDPHGFASPPRRAHELDDGVEGDHPVDGLRVAEDVARWRVLERRRLIDARLAVSASARREIARRVIGRLRGLMTADAVVSLYWPFRGELNLRDWMDDLHGAGVRVALPVVEAPGRPLVFREWTPAARLVPGVWKIPVPADGATLIPSIVIAPLVGFDGGCYRLGYGGGFFDRTFERLRADGHRPRAIGVGHSGARIRSIHPRPHDIPMDVIVTESEWIERSGSGT